MLKARGRRLVVISAAGNDATLVVAHNPKMALAFYRVPPSLPYVLSLVLNVIGVSRPIIL